ncbi:MAG: periplasmic heavy metal sensor [Armatimonadota bacterium]|nr:periplasmic heavy metal sensor [Armatimonadota bacterium]
MKRTMLFVVAVVLICALAADAQMRVGTGQRAQNPPPGGGMGFGMGFGMCATMAVAPPTAAMVDRMTDLQLTEDQATRLKSILTESEKQLMSLRQKVADACRALREAVFAEQYDSAKVQALASEAQKAESAVLSAELQTWAQIRSVLTAEQVNKLQGPVGWRGGPRQGGSRGAGGQPGGFAAPPPPPGGPQPPQAPEPGQ